MKIRVGNVWSWKPTAFCDLKTKEVPHTVRGMIIYVSAEHHYFTAEAFVNGYAIRESFKMRSAPEAVRRTGYRH